MTGVHRKKNFINKRRGGGGTANENVDELCMIRLDLRQSERSRKERHLL